MTSQPVTIVIHILSSILESKDNLTMKFGQLIEYNTGNIWIIIWKIMHKWGRETIARPFSKKSKLSLSLDQ